MSTSRDTIEITDGLAASTPRLTLKQTLERYGEIDICHKIGDPKEDMPWVRFRDCSAAQEALQAIERGEVTLDGFTLKAQWRTRKKDGAPIPASRREPPTSRDLFLERSTRRRSRSRTRSRSRRRSRGRGSRRRGRSRDRSSNAGSPPRRRRDRS
mmetsp:Transcript_89258/g.279523  ORF Transcript_89258/g.279523 Transcript_89258/m.279523 type:complete len:155 (+) Transcript_89258:130-594(+)